MNDADCKYNKTKGKRILKICIIFIMISLALTVLTMKTMNDKCDKDLEEVISVAYCIPSRIYAYGEIINTEDNRLYYKMYDTEIKEYIDVEVITLTFKIKEIFIHESIYK